jgi:hypothetical protein
MTASGLRCFGSLENLPPSANALLDGVGSRHLFTSRPWYESFVAAGLSSDAKPLFFGLVDSADRVSAMIACQRSPLADPAVSSLTSFYSCDFRPLISPDCDVPTVAFDLGGQLADHFSGEAAIRIDSLDASLPELPSFLAGLKRPGRALLRYAHFGRWSEDVAVRAFSDYLAARDGALRELIRRKGAKLNRQGAEFVLIGAGDPPAVTERGIADYQAVYAASWKEAEPFPDFQPVLMRKLAGAGWLRLAICRIGGRPIAAQLWAVVAGTATVLKLAHDRAFDKDSPGTVLTAFAIRTLMESERIDSIDFGRGDDAYKRAWARNRAAHIGVLSVDIKRRPALVARHIAGAALRRLRGGRPNP